MAFSEGKNSKQISKEIKSDKRVVTRLLFKAKNECILDSNHKEKEDGKREKQSLILSKRCLSKNDFPQEKLIAPNKSGLDLLA